MKITRGKNNPKRYVRPSVLSEGASTATVYATTHNQKREIIVKIGDENSTFTLHLSEQEAQSLGEMLLDYSKSTM